MRVSIRYQAAVVASVLGVAMVSASGQGYGQQVAESFHAGTNPGATVSVTTLRVPEKAWKHFSKAKAAVAQNRFAESDRETEKAIAIAPNFAEAYLLRADSEVQAHSYEAAIANVKEARRVEPDVMWASVILAGAYNGMRQYDEARKVLAGLHRGEAQTWQAAYEGARAAVGLKDTERALDLSALALSLAPGDFTDARLTRTNALILARRWSDAEAQIAIYLRTDPPENRRAGVLTVLGSIKRWEHEEDLQKLASR